MPNQPDGNARQRALKRCTELIDWYESHKKIQRIFDYFLQTSVILAAGFTAFAAAVQMPKWAIVLPAILTTVATGLSASFQFRTKYVNFASAAERLKLAKLRYEIRSENAQGDQKTLEEFVDNMEQIVTAELAEWREGLLTGDIAGKNTSRSAAGKGS
jgi:SMODS and SLOG-associating 2TM effector domain 1